MQFGKWWPFAGGYLTTWFASSLPFPSISQAMLLKNFVILAHFHNALTLQWKFTELYEKLINYLW